ncbi:hypothetical protein BKP37_17630 [Anaerobacillus alkalilacustris]|uniref:Molybdopterin cofactor biosynthesis MoaD-related C-terminal domain-containing protein n=1 Tax=Anaerobacillus alkalilacustris TaxID=393763 RepID=A0A1S2LGC6_9BACI|nr:hypothetical protein [Anaerobacillus alkalilacustris]OIJ10757.1 hypothetical protein BKP37_17630 [Anaerobacillus alkalilacustris]
MFEKELQIRGISRSNIINYVLQIGALETSSDSIFKGKCWSCEVSEEGSLYIFQSVIPMVTVTFTSKDNDILDKVIVNFRKKTFRAGG